MARKKSNSRGSLLGRSSKSSQDKTGLYLFLIIGIVVAVGLFLSYSGEEQVASGGSVVSEESSALVGQGTRTPVTTRTTEDTDLEEVECPQTLFIKDSDLSVNDPEYSIRKLVDYRLTSVYCNGIMQCSYVNREFAENSNDFYGEFDYATLVVKNELFDNCESNDEIDGSCLCSEI